MVGNRPMLTFEVLEQRLASYPSPVQALWRNALEALPIPSPDVTTIITFGSLVTGDFSYAYLKDTLYLFSDFEFTVITDLQPRERLRNATLEAVRLFNRRYAPEHLGFHLNLKLDTRDNFQRALQRNAFFHNTIATSGTLIFPGDGALALFPRSVRTIPESTIFSVLTSVISYLLFQLDIRMIKRPGLYPLYASFMIAKAAGKLASIYATLYGYFPGSVGKALAIIENRVPHDVHENLSQAEVHRNTAHASNALKPHLVRGLVSSLDHLVGTATELWDNRSGVRKLTRYHRVLKQHLLLHLRADSLPGEEEERLQTAQEILASKGEHYDFYKQLYGV